MLGETTCETPAPVPVNNRRAGFCEGDKEKKSMQGKWEKGNGKRRDQKVVVVVVVGVVVGWVAHQVSKLVI